jgi:hypothetical protein
MNKRIDELMVQAGARFEFLHGVHYDNFQYRKFAELIIKECATIANRAENDEYWIAPVGDLIYQHFRFKE